MFFQLEDKRIAAEKELAVFKLRYDSLRKAHNNVKHEMVQMRVSNLTFLFFTLLSQIINAARGCAIAFLIGDPPRRFY